MRQLFFITFISAILFSELAPYAGLCSDFATYDVEWPTEETSENESGEETIEDHVEEDQLFNDSESIMDNKNVETTLLPKKDKILFSQSLREIHIPPPDKI